MVGEVGVGAGDDFAGLDILRLEAVTVCRQNELGFGLRRGGASAQRGEGLRDSARCGDGNMTAI
jgi:hypothetical protein